jgi:acetyl-CoA acetyltransferase
VLVVANDAIESGCSVLAFLRDADNDEAREQAVLEGIDKIPSMLGTDLKTIGCAVVPKLEAWVLAALGNTRTEELTPTAADRALEVAGIEAKSTDAFVAVFEEVTLDKLPADATRLRRWLARAREVLEPVAE